MAEKFRRLVVVEQRPYRAWIAAALVVVLALAMFGIGWWAADRYTFGDVHDVGVGTARLQRELSELGAQNLELRAELARASQALRLERQAVEELSAILRGLEGNQSDLEREVAFFRRIMAPEQEARGLQVHDLDIEPVGPARVFRFVLTLTQLGRRESAAQGQVRMGLVGTRDGEEAELDSEQLGSAAAMPFRFRYFQMLEGSWSVPEGFEPETVRVEALPSGKNAKVVTKEFSWPFREGQDVREPE